jgi:alkylation response protein AidB-like acyl-CoA dehydrogenase
VDPFLNEEQVEIQKAARKFALGEFPQVAEQLDREETYPFDLLKKAASLGFIGAWIPEEYGGPGLGFLEASLITEEFWRVDPGCSSILSACFGGQMILYYGTEEQKKKYLSPIPAGEKIMGSAITEPNAGSDVAGIRTRATVDGDHFVINGTKMFITNATIADYFVVLCQTDPEAEKRHARFSVLIVEADRPGLTRRKIHNKLGIRASDTGELVFEDVRVPKENLVGERGRGFYQFMDFFDRTRVNVASQAVGLAQGALDRAIAYSKQREVFGSSLASFQVTQFKLAEMATRIEASRALVRQAAWKLDRGEVDTKLIAMAKWFSGETAVRVVDEALQIHGGYGFIGEYDISRLYRDAKIVEIYEGTKEIEKVIIGRRLLKD